MSVTISVLKDIVDIELVAMSLGIPMKHIGRKIQIICPSHNDKHFGSCYLTNNGYHCFACGAKGDVIELVMAANKCGFKEACKYLADLQGVSLDMNNANSINKQILDSESLELIGLHPIRGSVVYETTRIISEYEFQNTQIDSDRYRWIPYSSEQLNEYSGNGYYVLEKAVIKSPLVQLWQQDIRAYNCLIHDKALEAKERFHKLLINLQNKNQQETSLDYIESELLKDICNHVGYSTLSEYLKRNIAKCETIAIEHSSGKSRSLTSKEKERKSIFKVTKGVSI